MHAAIVLREPPTTARDASRVLSAVQPTSNGMAAWHSSAQVLGVAKLIASSRGYYERVFDAMAKERFVKNVASTGQFGLT
jgi:hypothetical protein